MASPPITTAFRNWAPLGRAGFGEGASAWRLGQPALPLRARDVGDTLLRYSQGALSLNVHLKDMGSQGSGHFRLTQCQEAGRHPQLQWTYQDLICYQNTIKPGQTGTSTLHDAPAPLAALWRHLGLKQVWTGRCHTLGDPQFETELGGSICPPGEDRHRVRQILKLVQRHADNCDQAIYRRLPCPSVVTISPGSPPEAPNQ